MVVLVLALGALVEGSSACVRRPKHSSSETQSNRPALVLETSWKVNINTASPRELEKLPGVGEVLAERIVNHRTQHGPFRRVEHLMMIHGISERKFRQLQPMITVE
jgi:competence ComEA-like helix-hairpin-helix protein